MRDPHTNYSRSAEATARNLQRTCWETGTGSNTDLLSGATGLRSAEASPLELKHERRATDLPSAQFQNRPAEFPPENKQQQRKCGGEVIRAGV
ncbi:hypothetical protein D4764_16G0009340 [Takifugu flavidus]|uniref:Uncharacterized protein n=1 Tax=Takifugu flavidus TaxID=433684 RepID=A0A5C6P2V6_9TELE|nr:hypothetical protein D4764_16G0009340 [Takifugu flavidus]